MRALFPPLFFPESKLGLRKNDVGICLWYIFNAVIHCWFASKHAKGMSLRYDAMLLQWINTGGLKQKHKKQPWGNVECFAFGGATVRFASLETSFHAANHTIPPPPSYEGSPHCTKDKNRSPLHGEKPLMIT